MTNYHFTVILKFLSTLSLRRATFSIFASPFSIFYFYPRSPCGERPGERASIKPIFGISIHALLAESDIQTDGLFFINRRFLSTLSLRRATAANSLADAPPKISIHALLAESDISCSLRYWSRAIISIHALLAESDVEAYRQASLAHRISIHALLAESDSLTAL